MSRPRVGIVGWGEIAGYHARHLRAAGARVAGAVTTRNLPDDVRRYPTLAAMLPDVDAVTIAVPNHLHARLCLEAVAHHRPVFVEKPLCISRGELAELEAAFRASRVPVMVGFRLRRNPALVALRAGRARIRSVRCVYRLGVDRLAAGKPWTTRAAQSGGAFFVLGVHALDTARWIARAEARPLTGLHAAARSREGAEFPLEVSIRGELPDGALVEAAADLRGNSEFRLTIEIDGEGDALAEALPPDLRPEHAGAPDVEYGALMAEFVRAMTNPDDWTDDRAEALQCHRELLEARAMVEE